MAVFIGIYTKFYKNQYIKLFNFLIKDGYKYNNIYIIKRFYKKKEITDLDKYLVYIFYIKTNNSIFQNNGFIYTIIFFLNLYYLLFDYKNIIIKFMERNLLISDYLLYIIEF